MCHTPAPLRQASTHAPHFMHVLSVVPASMDRRSSESVGQLDVQSDTQPAHASRSTRMSKTLVQLKSDWNAPKGQRNVHCVRFLVTTGSATTRPAKSALKMPNCRAVCAERTSGNSVTALNGHSHSQYA